MTNSRQDLQSLTESAMALALCTIIWWVFTFIPGIGRYFKYMIASLIAGVGVRCGVRWSLGVVFGLNAFIASILGPSELLNCLFLVTPMGLLLPTHPRLNQWDTEAYSVQHGISNDSSMGFSLIKWWGKLLIIYALSFTTQLWIKGVLLHVRVTDVTKSVVLASYHIHTNLWESVGISADDLVAIAVDWVWVGLSIVGMGYGAFLYLINRPVYQGYLLLQKRARLD